MCARLAETNALYKACGELQQDEIGICKFTFTEILQLNQAGSDEDKLLRWQYVGVNKCEQHRGHELELTVRKYSVV